MSAAKYDAAIEWAAASERMTGVFGLSFVMARPRRHQRGSSWMKAPCD